MKIPLEEGDEVVSTVEKGSQIIATTKKGYVYSIELRELTREGKNGIKILLDEYAWFVKKIDLRAG